MLIDCWVWCAKDFHLFLGFCVFVWFGFLVVLLVTFVFVCGVCWLILVCVRGGRVWFALYSGLVFDLFLTRFWVLSCGGC